MMVSGWLAASVRLVLTGEHRRDAVYIGEYLRCRRDPGAGQSHRYPNLTAVDIVGVRVQFGELPISLPARPQQLSQHAAAVLVNDVQPDGPTQPRIELSLHHIESQRADEMQGHDDGGEQQQARACRKTYRGGFHHHSPRW
jgi:hypothetical protein